MICPGILFSIPERSDGSTSKNQRIGVIFHTISPPRRCVLSVP